MENARQIFGDNYLTWFLPIQSKIKANYLEALYKYEEIMKGIDFYEDLYKTNPIFLKHKVQC